MRLTNKYDGYQIYQLEDNLEAINKLGQLEDIEEELGIDLITLFKALKIGIWVGGKDEYGLTFEPKLWKAKTFEIKYHKFMGLCFSKITGGHTYNKTEDNFGFTLNYSAVALKAYGKTWALTKEELL